MSVINPDFAEENFTYSFGSINYNYSPPKLKSVKLEQKNFKKIVKVVLVLENLKTQKWREIPKLECLYGGDQANPIKEEKSEPVKKVIRNAFANHEADYSDEAKYYPSYLSVTKEMRIFGYQWKGVFNVVLIDLHHDIHGR
ncbi:MAG: hypothetical protein OXB96_02000 [Candidatus Kaiserbacteria bacterium]|nr:hypothetical protein [Candidatus Kaiserbacteria bacterium]